MDKVELQNILKESYLCKTGRICMFVSDSAVLTLEKFLAQCDQQIEFIEASVEPLLREQLASEGYSDLDIDVATWIELQVIIGACRHVHSAQSQQASRQKMKL